MIEPLIFERLELLGRLEEIARVPVLLVGSDYDGTLAPIVSDPSRARADREVMVALKALAGMAQTHVAIISGRALDDLAALTGSPDDVHLVGSHGSEFDPGFAATLPPGARELRDRLVAELAEIADRGHGFLVEEKPAGVAFHYRNAPPAEVEPVLEAIRSGPAAHDDVFTRHGKMVVELSVVATDKGHALEKLRHQLGASAAVFIGDDVTDESAFKTLKGPDLGIKVGPGETAAPFRVTDPTDVAHVLAALAEIRAEWLAGSDAVPIEAHSMLSDQRTIALITPDARVTWLCAPRVDSPAILAELLGGTTAGTFAISAADGAKPTQQRYLDRTLILETRWPTFTVTDYLDCSAGRTTQRAGRTELVRVIEGTGKVRIEFAPRLDFGRIETRITRRDGGLEVEPSPDPIVLRSRGIEWEIVEEGRHQTARAEVELGSDPVVVEFRYGTGNLRDPVIPESVRRGQTSRFWTHWAENLVLPGVEPGLVLRSALTLKGLCFGPTGGIAAAGTTSLPEYLGGVRNWDYRYSWLRDAALTAAALVQLGSATEAMQFLDWVLGIVDESPAPERLRPLYSVTGQDLGPEAEIAELAGYAGSRPVRIGNAAAQQVQLDVFGPIVDLVHILLERGAPISSQHWRLVEAMVSAVEQRWTEPDHGIWEIRGPRRHHVHSKVMCWVTVDRAVRIADGLLGRDRDDWKTLRDEIAEDIFAHGWKPEVNAFTAAYDGVDLDAAGLQIGLSGLVGGDDARFVATVEAIEHALRDGPTVRRYHIDDGLPGSEGGFHLLASWLIDAYLLVGRVEDARTRFAELIALVGNTGLLSEQYDPKARRALGNHPQAYSHLGLIMNALHLAKVD